MIDKCNYSTTVLYDVPKIKPHTKHKFIAHSEAQQVQQKFYLGDAIKLYYIQQATLNDIYFPRKM